jgi:type IX secretion system PorP/SprF family membrane protein
MRKQIITFFMVMCSGAIYAQDPHLSQYFNIPVFYNPALAGSDIQNMRIALDYRNQWLAPGLSNKTQTIALDKIVNKVGFGLMISKNTVGKDGFSRLNIIGGVNYNLWLGKQKYHHLSSGFQVGIIQKSFDPNKLSFESQYTPDIGYDPSASNGETFANTKVTPPDVNAGFAYHFAQGKKDIILKPFAGISFSHLNQPKESFIEQYNSNPIRINMHGGVGIMCSDALELKPMVYFMKQQGFQEINTGVLSALQLQNQNVVKLGLFYRNNDAVIAYAGYQINKVFLGTSYDFNVSKYKPGGSGAYEISLVYTPQGKARGKRTEENKPQPINRKKLPEQKITAPETFITTQSLAPAMIEQTPIVMTLNHHAGVSSTDHKNASPLSGYQYDKMAYVVFSIHTTQYDINNRFDVIESVIDFLYKNPDRKIILAGNVSAEELRKNATLGKARAETVKKYMLDKGIASERIIIMDLKDTMPDKMVEEGKTVTRLQRTDILLIK